MTARRGVVYWDKVVAGRIEELADGDCLFVYDRQYLSNPESMPISLTLPLREAPYETRGLHPFFDGLVPEGWLLDIATRNWKIDPRDRLGLLLSTCSDCVGAVRVVPEDSQ
jgi:serine/threonine-protein kinase HipA